MQWPRARAIIWAQWRTLLNSLPHVRKSGFIFTAILSLFWYGLFVLAAVAAALTLSDRTQRDLIATVLPSGLLLGFLYWQVIPIVLASAGSALDLKKLRVYPIPTAELFGLEVALRVTTGGEVLIVIVGAAIGLLLNPSVPKWAPLTFVPYVFLNLFFSVGMRDLMTRMFSHKRVRELAGFVFIMIAALPSVAVNFITRDQLRVLSKVNSFVGWPWAVTANLAQGHFTWHDLGALLGWTVLAWAFGRWQFAKALAFDEGAASSSSPVPGSRRSPMDSVYSASRVFLSDPVAGIVEKEMRSLVRSPRFRLVFVMGFSFGLMVWFPTAFGRGRSQVSFLGEHYLTLVTLYGTLLLSDTLFWNAFGFDRGAAQMYFLLPIPFSRVLIGKNISAVFFVLLETTIIVLVCTVLRLQVTPAGVGEAYLVAAIVLVYLLAIGNMTSTYNPRPVDASKTLRQASAARTQALLMLFFPVALIPVLLAFGARYAFQSELAFYALLLFAAGLGAVVYWISLESAVEAAEKRKELFAIAVSQGSGPIEG